MIYFYSYKINKLKEYKWDEYNILTKLYNNDIRLPKLNENSKITKKYLDNIILKLSNLEKYIPLYNINIRVCYYF